MNIYAIVLSLAIFIGGRGQDLQNAETPHTIDVKAFFNEIDNMDCNDPDRQIHPEENEVPTSVLCPEQVESLSLKPMGDLGKDQNHLQNFLDANFYKPLAFGMVRRNNYADVVSDLLFLNPKLSMIKDNIKQTDYRPFKDSVRDLFEALQNHAVEDNYFADDRSAVVTELLKRFHIYWNSLRLEGQFGRAKSDTKSVMTEISQLYLQKYKYLSEVTKIFVEKLKDAYFRFLRAHKMLEVLNREAEKILAQQFVRRYVSVANEMRDGKIPPNIIARETFFLLKIALCFHVVNYKNGLNEASSIAKFNTLVRERIESEYETVKCAMSDKASSELKIIRDFTAVLLLKCRHLMYKIFYFNRVTEVINNPAKLFEWDYDRLTQIYNRAKDNLMMVPKICINYAMIKSCTLHEVKKVFRYVVLHFRLNKSTFGYEIREYLKELLNAMFKEMQGFHFASWSEYKRLYYENLFVALTTYKRHFYINDDEVIDDLENLVGIHLEESKQLLNHSFIDLKVYDVFQNTIYNLFVELKGKYNKWAPYDRQEQILMQISGAVNDKVKTFLKENRHLMDPHNRQIKDIMEAALKKWIEYELHKPVTTIQVTNLVTPFAPDISTSTYVDLNARADMNIVPYPNLVLPPSPTTVIGIAPHFEPVEEPKEPEPAPELPVEYEKVEDIGRGFPCTIENGDANRDITDPKVLQELQNDDRHKYYILNSDYGMEKEEEPKEEPKKAEAPQEYPVLLHPIGNVLDILQAQKMPQAQGIAQPSSAADKVVATEKKARM